jgi:hypothetical protein
VGEIQDADGTTWGWNGEEWLYSDRGTTVTGSAPGHEFEADALSVRPTSTLSPISRRELRELYAYGGHGPSINAIREEDPELGFKIHLAYNRRVSGQAYFDFSMALLSFAGGEAFASLQAGESLYGSGILRPRSAPAGGMADEVIREATACHNAAVKAAGGMADDVAAKWRLLTPDEMRSVVGGGKIRFGKDPNQVYHTFRHVEGMGMDRNIVQNAVLQDFEPICSQVISGKPFIRIINVNGQRLQYTAYRLQDGTYNIGRIHGVE